MLTALLSLPLLASHAQAVPPTLALGICRAGVEPCQSEVSIPAHGAVDLDLVLRGAPGAAIVGWQAHLQLENSRAAEPVLGPPSGLPVQEQGGPGLALNGLAPLPAAVAPGGGRFFTVQNRYDPASGRLDYAVTLVRPEPGGLHPGTLPLHQGAGLRLGRITLGGAAEGSSYVSVVNSPTDSLRVVILDPSAGLVPISPGAGPGPLATIHVGQVSTPELRGRIDSPGSGGADSPALAVPGELAVSFWEAGAVPPWRGGGDGPLAAFYHVATDGQGGFSVSDIAPSLLPPGVYDLRVQGRGTLARLVPAVSVPAPIAGGGPPAMAPVSVAGLPVGDVNGDNVVDQADLEALRAGFGMAESQAGFNPNADFNGDGVVDVLDFSLLAQNFGRRGQ